MVNQDGVVYERDLGWKTGDLARAMTGFNPTSDWRKVEALPRHSRLLKK
jgi:hypothetical protein